MAQKKSGRQRAEEIAVRRRQRTAQQQEKQAGEIHPAYEGEQVTAPVNASLLADDNSYGVPEFVGRGNYVDRKFTCNDCGKEEVWHATQQKWWYEVAKGGVWTVAVRCRPCRRRERDRAAAHKRRSEEGLLRKAHKNIG